MCFRRSKIFIQLFHETLRFSKKEYVTKSFICIRASLLLLYSLVHILVSKKDWQVLQIWKLFLEKCFYENEITQHSFKRSVQKNKTIWLKLFDWGPSLHKVKLKLNICNIWPAIDTNNVAHTAWLYHWKNAALSFSIETEVLFILAQVFSGTRFFHEEITWDVVKRLREIHQYSSNKFFIF